MRDIAGIVMFVFAVWMVFNVAGMVHLLIKEYADPIMDRLWRIEVWCLLTLCAVMAVFDVSIGIYCLS